MGNLEKAGVGVVVALLLIIMVVAFTADPQATEPIEEPKQDAALALERETDSQESDALIDPESARLVRPAPAELPDLPDVVTADPGLPERSDPPHKPGAPKVRPVRPLKRQPSPTPGRTIPERDVRPVSPVLPSPLGWPKQVVVAQNDSLWRIAASAYGRGQADRMVPIVREFNGLKTDVLRVKQKLRLPAPPVTAPKAGAPSLLAGGAKRVEGTSGAPRVTPVSASGLPWEPGPASYRSASGGSGGSGDGWYVVKRNESLGQIAQEQLGSVKFVKDIMQLNGIKNPDRISEGRRLKMPKRKK